MKLSTHFTLVEMEVSQTATRLGIRNKANETQKKALKLLCQKTLEPLRIAFDIPLFISSGFRCRKLNTAIGGSATSQHMKGEAADISVEGMTTEALFDYIIESGIAFDQLIQEFDSWVHISYRANARGQKLYATHNSDGSVVYTPA